MDHAVSSLILSQFLFLFCLDPLRPEARGSLETCHVTFGCQCSARRSNRGGPVHISWKWRKPAAHTTSSRSSSTSSASLWLMSLALAAAPVRQPRTHIRCRRARRSAHLPGGQSSRTAKLLRTERFSPG